MYLACDTISQSRGTSMIQDITVPLSFSQRERHNKLWFNDGTVVLATPTILFRIYGGILAHHSPVFRDMFSLPQPLSIGPSSNQESMDGVPIVEIHDDPEDLEHLLCAIFYQSYYNSTVLTKFPIVASILQLSSKYQMQSLREQAIRQFLTVFPNNLEALDHPESEGELVEDCDPLQMIRIARMADAMQLLPVVFYRIAIELHHPIGSEEPPSSNPEWLALLNTLSSEDITRVCFGRERLQRAFREEFARFIYKKSPSSCNSPAECSTYKEKTSLRRKAWCSYDKEPAILKHGIVERWVSALEKAGLCEVCSQTLRMSMEEGRRSIWNKLPKYFGLPDWDVLRATAICVEESDP